MLAIFEGQNLAASGVPGFPEDIIGHGNRRTPLHAEEQGFIPARTLEVEAIAGKRLGNNVVNKRRSLRHSVDPSVRWTGKVHFEHRLVNNLTSFRFVAGRSGSTAKPTEPKVKAA